MGVTNLPLQVRDGRVGSHLARSLRKVLAAREFSVLAVLAVFFLWLFFTSARTIFFSRFNLENLLRNIALLGTFSIGETVVIISGGIDLSLGSLIAFSGMLLALTATSLQPHGAAVAVTAAVIITLAASLAIGAAHGLLTHRLRLPPFAVTLASLTILRSQALVMNRQLPIPVTDFPVLGWLANGNLFRHSLFPIPVPLVVVALLALITQLLLSRARIGRYVYSLGNNEQATRLSGVNVGAVKLFAYSLSALFGGVAGILYAGYGGQGDPLSGGGYELNAVAAAVIGGASLMGGQGSVAGTLLGASLLQVIITYINLKVANPSLWEGTVYGGVLLFAVLVTALQQRARA